eukprot:gene30174-36452_t
MSADGLNSVFSNLPKESQPGSAVSSSLSSLQTSFDYNNTEPLPSFQPASPFQFFSKLNEIHPRNSAGKVKTAASDDASFSSASIKTPVPRKKPRPKANPEDNVAFSDRDKRQMVQCLADYIRVFCGLYKQRFSLEDIENLFAYPPYIKPRRLDSFYEQRLELFTCLFDYFKAAKVHPVKWFDIITNWKGGHKRVMNEEEFVVGFNRFCDEFDFALWQESDLSQVFQFLLRSKQSYSELRRQDIRFAMKRCKLSKRRIHWLNRQAKTLKQLQRFLRKIRASFHDFCPSIVIRKKGKTVTLHEVESMLMLIVKDMAIFTECKHKDDLLSTHFKKLGVYDNQIDRRTSLSSADGGSSIVSRDSMDDLSYMSDQGSVGSLLSLDGASHSMEDQSQAPQRPVSNSSPARSSSYVAQQYVPFSTPAPHPPIPPSLDLSNLDGAEAKSKRGSMEMRASVRNKSGSMMKPPSSEGIRGSIGPRKLSGGIARSDSADAGDAVPSIGSMVRVGSNVGGGGGMRIGSVIGGGGGLRIGSVVGGGGGLRIGSVMGGGGAVRVGSVVGVPPLFKKKGIHLLIKEREKQLLSPSDSETDTERLKDSRERASRGSREADSSRETTAAGASGLTAVNVNEDPALTNLKRHYNKNLQPEELKYLERLVEKMDLPVPTGGGQVAYARTPKRRGSALARQYGENPQDRRRSILKRHSIIQRYTVIRTSRVVTRPVENAESKAGSPKNADYGGDEVEGAYAGILSRHNSHPDLQSHFQDSVSDQYSNLLESNMVDGDELAAFEASLEEKKAKHMKTFENITSHFDRRVNIARARLNKMHAI